MWKTSYHHLFIFFSFSSLLSIYSFNVFRDHIIGLFLVGLVLLILLNYYNWVQKFGSVLFCIFLGSIFWVVISHFHWYEIQQKEQIIENFDDTQQYEVILEIKNVYKKEDFDIAYMAKILQIADRKIEKDVFSIFKTKKNFDLWQWQTIKINSKVQTIKNFNTEFDYRSYLQSKWIYSIFYSHNFINIWQNKVSFLRYRLDIIRRNVLESIHAMYPRNEAVFLWGILLWARENIPDQMSESFNNSGLTHLIAVSWYNITIVIVFLSYILLYLPKVLKITIVSTWVFLYVFLVGDSPAVIRAGIMWIIWYYVLMSWAKGDSLAIILLTALIMLSWNPFLINYDISFQLSFLAVFWLLYTQWFFEKTFFFLPKKFAIQESFVLTLSAFVFTIPIMLHNFWQISVLAPIANMLVAWTIPFAMFFGMLSIIAHKVFIPIAYVIWYWEYFLLKWTTSIAHYFWDFHLTIVQVELGNYWYYFQGMYFIVVIFLILYFKKSEGSSSNQGGTILSHHQDWDS